MVVEKVQSGCTLPSMQSIVLANATSWACLMFVMFVKFRRRAVLLIQGQKSMRRDHKIQIYSP